MKDSIAPTSRPPSPAQAWPMVSRSHDPLETTSKSRHTVDEDGFTKREAKPKKHQLSGPRPPPPAKVPTRASRPPYNNKTLYIQSDEPLELVTVAASEGNAILHANKRPDQHFTDGLKLMKSKIDDKHPSFIDKRNNDLYRFDTETGRIAIAARPQQQAGNKPPVRLLKTSYTPEDNTTRTLDYTFRRLALVAAFNVTDKPVSALSGKSGIMSAKSGQVKSEREVAFERISKAIEY